MSDEKIRWPFGGFFLKLSDEKNGTHEYEDYLKECEGEKQVSEENLEFHYSKDPKAMTMQESLDEMGRLLRWNRMSPEERRVELETQKAATRATEQAARDMPCTMEPESAPDIPQGTVLDEVLDNPPGVDRVLDGVSGDTPERVMDTAPDSVPDDGPDTTEEAVPEAAEGNVPDEIGTLTVLETLMQQEAETTRQVAEPEAPEMEVTAAKEMSIPQMPEPAELQEECCTRQAAEETPEVVPTETIVPLGQIGGDAPAEKERWPYASELIGDAFRHWENGRVLLDMGTGRGKNEFIIKRLASWCVDEMLTNGIMGRVLYLCPLNTLHAEMLQRRMEAAIAEADDEPMEIVMTYDMLYESVLEVQTYQHIETKYRNDPASLKKYLAQFKYIVADECHYFTDFSSYGINTYLSLEVLQKAEADHVVIYMSATGEETYKLLEETAKTPEDRIYQLPQDYRHIKQKYFYSRENLVMMLKSLPEDEKAVIFVSSGEDLLKMKETFGDTAAYYCSDNNPKYGKKFNELTECIKDSIMVPLSRPLLKK